VRSFSSSELLDGGLWDCRDRVALVTSSSNPWIGGAAKAIAAGCPAALFYLTVRYLADSSSRLPTGIRHHERCPVPVLEPSPWHIAHIPSTQLCKPAGFILSASFEEVVGFFTPGILSVFSHAYLGRHHFGSSRVCMDAPSFSHGNVPAPFCCFVLPFNDWAGPWISGIQRGRRAPPRP
jgi:hypothetical protein